MLSILLLIAGVSSWALANAGAETTVRDLLAPRVDGSEPEVHDRAGWERRRAAILAAMQRVMGPLPGPEKRVPLDVKIEREEDAGGYVRRKLSYAAAPGERVPAYLLLPKSAGRHPAVLALHQTVAIGKDEPVGLGGSANLHYGSEMAERGYVVLAPDYPTMGENPLDPYAHGWQSGSMPAIWENIRGVDLLESLPAVDRKRIGCLGHSLGGHNTLFTAAFEPRIRALVSNCGFTSFRKYYGGNLAGWTGPRYMPRIKTDFPTPEKMPFDFDEVVASLAPRAFLAIAPVHDANFEVTGVQDVMASARPVYTLFHAADRLAERHPDCQHDWPLPERKAAYAWLDRWLSN